jgi:hypothetical protein
MFTTQLLAVVVPITFWLASDSTPVPNPGMNAPQTAVVAIEQKNDLPGRDQPATSHSPPKPGDVTVQAESDVSAAKPGGADQRIANLVKDVVVFIRTVTREVSRDIERFTNGEWPVTSHADPELDAGAGEDR